MQFIVRLAPEISIKSAPVRRRLTAVLRLNVVNAAQRRGLCVQAQAQWDKLLVRARLPDNAACADDQALEQELRGLLECTPGIHSFMLARPAPLTDFAGVYAAAAPVYAAQVCGRRFAVRVRRRGNHSFRSRDVECALGAMFLRDCPGSQVDLTTPEVTVRVEIDAEQVYVVTSPQPGLGGFPLSTQGQVLALVSGGFDSAVAAFRALRRGLVVHYLFFSLGGSVQEQGVMQTCLRLWRRFGASHRVRFVSVPFEQAAAQIVERTHHGVRGVLLKRLMLRVAGELALRLGLQAVVTGESVGQVSSQTLTNLAHIDRACPVLVLRPLSCCDKQEIIDEAERLGTAELARAMPEYCAVISDHPNVCPRSAQVEEQEALLDAGLCEQLLAQARVLDIRSLEECTRQLQAGVEVVAAPGPGETVIDIRAPEEVRSSPLALECLELPFYRLLGEFAALDPSRTYVLYCAQGVMSRLQAQQLRERGHSNVKVLELADAARCRRRAPPRPESVSTP